MRELHVEDPHEGEIGWDARREQYLDMALDGIPLTDELRAAHAAEFGTAPESDPRLALTRPVWDAYLLAYPDIGERADSPGERLAAYFSLDAASAGA